MGGWNDPGTPGVPFSGPIPAGYQFFYNVVGTTGPHLAAGKAINHLNVTGQVNKPHRPAPFTPPRSV